MSNFKKFWDGPLYAGWSLLPILSNLSLFTFSFITSSKLAQFQDPIPVLESTLNLLSHGVVSYSIMISFDIAMIQNRFNFGENLRKYFRKFFFQQKILNCSNFTFSSSIWAKSGTIGKEIAWGFRKWCWILIFVKIRLRYGEGWSGPAI